jgi:hypothetical protein
MARIIETDNFGGDYPDEKFLNLPLMPPEAAKVIARTINSYLSGENYSRYWRVVDDDYVLKPGFEP